MKTNLAGIDLIKRFEGLRLAAYLCPAGIPTIGYGHTGDVNLGQYITEHQADVILQHDLEKFEEILEKAVRVKLNANQHAALVSLVFNVGPGKKGVRDGIVELKSGKPSTLLRFLNDGQYAAAAAQFSKWIHAGGKVLPGLVKRRAAEAALFQQVPV